jgi:hypothetical protein
MYFELLVNVVGLVEMYLGERAEFTVEGGPMLVCWFILFIEFGI